MDDVVLRCLMWNTEDTYYFVYLLRTRHCNSFIFKMLNNMESLSAAQLSNLQTFFDYYVHASKLWQRGKVRTLISYLSGKAAFCNVNSQWKTNSFDLQQELSYFFKAVWRSGWARVGFMSQITVRLRSGLGQNTYRIGRGLGPTLANHSRTRAGFGSGIRHAGLGLALKFRPDLVSRTKVSQERFIVTRSHSDHKFSPYGPKQL